MEDVAADMRQGNQSIGTCPHIDRDDPRCASRFNIGRLDQAFSVCFGSFYGCPMYHRINHEQARRPLSFAEPAPLITITAHGRTLPLRPTGT